MRSAVHFVPNCLPNALVGCGPYISYIPISFMSYPGACGKHACEIDGSVSVSVSVSGRWYMYYVLYAGAFVVTGCSFLASTPLPSNDMTAPSGFCSDICITLPCPGRNCDSNMRRCRRGQRSGL